MTSAAQRTAAHAATARADVKVTPVQGKKDLDRFVKLPWKIYENDPVWVPPLLHDVNILLDRNKHPFHKHADVEYFLATRDNEVVGRIAAIINQLHNEFHEDKVGFFGFFESIDDQAVADALLSTAEQWVRSRGMQEIRGPMNFSVNEECGLVVDGFDVQPVIMMTHNPQYYMRLLENAGYAKAKDLLAYYMEGMKPPEVLTRRLERARKSEGVEIRLVDLKRFDEEVATFKEIYNSAWEKNWGFVPMTDEEFNFLAKQLRPVVDPHLVLVAEVKGEPVGFAIGLPDFNQALKKINGRLLPFGLLKLLWHKRHINLARIVTLGLKPGFRKMGIDAMLYSRLFEEGPPRGYTRGEGSWILEDNWEMRRGMERFGAVVYRTYRIYEKLL
jgi:GNAT superfamily N-acetyltransferase